MQQPAHMMIWVRHEYLCRNNSNTNDLSHWTFWGGESTEQNKIRENKNPKTKGNSTQWLGELRNDIGVLRLREAAPPLLSASGR